MAATSWDSLDSWFDILTLAGMSLQLERDHAVPNDLHLLMYRQYHTLRLVCKAFRDLFKKHPSLSDCVLVREGLPGSRVPQLLNAMHRNQASTCALMAFAQARAADAALAVLLCPTPRLQKLTLNWASESTVHLVSALLLSLSVIFGNQKMLWTWHPSTAWQTCRSSRLLMELSAISTLLTI